MYLFECQRWKPRYYFLRRLAAVNIFVQHAFDSDAVTLDADIVGRNKIEIFFQLHFGHPTYYTPI